ncbi:MAG: SdrD B-like domain-containing protein, partial [Chloroflexales bacterium]
NQLVGLGDTVWDDLNRNGIQDAGEPGVPGVTVTLYNASTNTQVGTPQITDAYGYYQYVQLPPDRYYLVFSDLPTGYFFTPQGQGDNSAADSDADPISGQTAVIDLLSNQSEPAWDAGIYTLASMGDRVWLDVNGNGVQDAGEAGANDLVVTLYRADGTEVAHTTTAAVDGEDGIYRFSDLLPDRYYLTFSGLPAGYIFSPTDSGASDTLDSDADQASGKTSTFGLTSGASDLSRDAGVYLPASVGGRVWDDSNTNGIFESGEAGIAGVVEVLYHSDGSLAAKSVTDNDGRYVFSALGAGDYYLQFYTQLGWGISPQGQGGDTDTPSSADPSSGRTAVFTLAAGSNDLSWWAGMSRLPTVITLQSFTVERQADGNLLSWETSAELNNAGFAIYRSATGLRADAELVASELAARGVGGAGARYSWLDASASPQVSYSYWLAALEFSGARREYPLNQPDTLQRTTIMLPFLITGQRTIIMLPLFAH